MEKVNPKLSNIVVSLFRSSNCGHYPLADFADHETNPSEENILHFTIAASAAAMYFFESAQANHAGLLQ
jgi:hypothetical protein